MPAPPIPKPVEQAPTHFRKPVVAYVRALIGEEIPKSALGLFFDMLAILLKSGTSHPEAIVRASGYVDSELRYICNTIAPKLRSGLSLSEALQPFNRRFPPIVVPILAVGDVSGTLEHSARRLADTFVGSVSIERKMRGKVFNPWIAIIVVTLFHMYTQFSIAKLSYVGIFINAAITMAELSAIYLVGRLVWRQLARWSPLRMVVDTIAISLPNFGMTLRYLAASRWARSFATLWSAGVAVSRSLEVSARTASNAYYERAILDCALQTRKGRSLTAALKTTQLFPPPLLTVIATGEESGRIAEGLENLAKIMEDEAFTRAIKAMNGIVMTAQVLTLIVVAVMALDGLV